MNTIRVIDIKDEKVRGLLLEIERKGYEVARRTVGHESVDAYTVLIMGFASFLVDLKKDIKSNIYLGESNNTARGTKQDAGVGKLTVWSTVNERYMARQIEKPENGKDAECNIMKSTTTTLISALRILARDIQSDDGVANAAIAEAADRLKELEAENSTLRDAAAIIRNALEEYDSDGVNGNQYRLINTVRRAINDATRKETQS